VPPLKLETAAPPIDPSLLSGPAADVDEDAVIAEVREAIAEATSAPSISSLDKDALHAARRAAVDIATATLAASSTETAEHSDDVDIIAEGVGRRLGLSGSRLEDVRVAARLHDIGKLGVPRRIIEKPDRLDPAEWAVIRRHTIIGEQILLAVPELRKAARLVRHSHERWDGEGYPDGLAGEQIPLGSRIVFCADAYHAIRSDRAYRAGRPAVEALAEIRSCAGAQFDPAVVEALEDLAFELRAIPEVRRRAAFGRSRRLLALMLVISVGACGSALARTGVIPDAKAPLGTVTGPAGASTAASSGYGVTQPSSSLTRGDSGDPAGAVGKHGRRVGIGPKGGYGLLTALPLGLAISPAQTNAAITQAVQQPASPAAGQDAAEAGPGTGTGVATAPQGGSSDGAAKTDVPKGPTASSGAGKAKSKAKKGRGSSSGQTAPTATSGSTDSSSASGKSNTPAAGPATSTGKGKPKSSGAAESKSSSGKGQGKKNAASGSGTSAVAGQTDDGEASSSGKGKKDTSTSTASGPPGPKPPKPPKPEKGPKPPPPVPPQSGAGPQGPPPPPGGPAASGIPGPQGGSGESGSGHGNGHGQGHG
jgi:hypothetical protein